jgi:hypothetical protein
MPGLKIYLRVLFDTQLFNAGQVKPFPEKKGKKAMLDF